MNADRLLLAPLAAAVLLACSSAESRDDGGARSAAAPGAVSAGDAKGDAQTDPMVARADSGRVRGGADAKVWMVIVSDFQCPFCRMWHDSVDATLRREYVDNGRVRMAFVNFPLRQHANARPASEAAMCASAQGKFWEMHDAIFESQDRWQGLPDARAMFEQLAQGVGVDVAALRACVASGKMRPLIDADYQRGIDAQVRSTPSFFIGDQAMAGVAPLADYRRALDAALAAAGAR